MKYKNTKTGFVFESNSVVKAEGWVLLDPTPTTEKKNETKPTTKKRTAKK